ncbi:hypothetical protein P8881_19040 [Bacillus haynesii]|nr:hypothetical protein [Bacillus haynesii]MEC0738776.1 hypothetical protein [Bacillus haynesii]
MFKVVYLRNQQRFIKPFDTKDAAMDFGKMGSDYGELYFEYVLDKNDVIVCDRAYDLFDSPSMVGKKFVYADDDTIETE